MQARLDPASHCPPVTLRPPRLRRVFPAIPMTIGLLGAIVTMSPVGSAAEEVVSIPDTPVGRQLSWFLASLNAGEVLPTSTVSDHFAPAVLQHRRPAGIVRSLAMASQALAPVTLARLEGTPTENEIVAVVRERDTAMHRVTLATDPYSGHRISDWSIRPLERVKPGEIGGVMWDDYRDAPLLGIDMELVDGTTGRAFVPGVRCRTDFAGYCRLAVPDGAGPIAVKVMNTLLWGRMDTYNFLAEGALGSDLTVFDGPPPNSLAFFARRAGIEPDLTKGHLYGLLAYVDAETGHFLAWAGCGQVELTPSSARIFYTKDPIAPDPSRSRTSPRVSAWWAFNLDPGRYGITAHVGGRTLDATVAVLQPETFGFIRIPIAWDRSVPLPRCE
jgi:hypothetical protein